MCTVSMIMDHYRDKWTAPQPVSVPVPQAVPSWVFAPSQITREEFDQLKREVEDMKALLKRAKRYDDEHGEPDCEVDEKVKLVKQIADLVGVSLDDVFGK